MLKNRMSFIEKILSFLNLNTVRKKLIFYSAFMVVIMGSFNIYSFFYVRHISRQYNSIMRDLYFFNRVSVEFNSINDSFESILSDILNYREQNNLYETLSEFEDDIKNIEKRSRNTDNWVRIAGLRGLVETYNENVEKTLTLFKNNENYYEKLSYCRMVAKFINRRINEIVSYHLTQSSILYSEIEENSRRMQVYSALTILALFVFNAVVIVYFSNGISRPIRSLAKRAERIASGDLNVSDVLVNTNDEVALLANSFNKMSNNIRKLIDEIVEKANIEKKLKEEEMKNLKVTNMLKETELKVLQSQLNPHFLFNTLNTIARMAMLEDANTTLNLIESTSELLRYNLGKIKQGTVTLRDEIDNVKEYVFIQQIRFSDRITFNFDIDESLLDTHVPYLFLQPLVENAIIHGIEPKEGKGSLQIKVYSEDENVVIEVKDDGVGIPEEKMKYIYDDKESTSIGLCNVKKRMEYYYNDSNLLKVWSKPGEGTLVKVIIPKGTRDGEINV